MTTKVSTKGQVVLPGAIRRKLDLRPGDALEAHVEAGRIVLTPKKPRRHRTRVVTDPVTGLPVLSAGPDAPVLRSREVTDILADFP